MRCLNIKRTMMAVALTAASASANATFFYYFGTDQFDSPNTTTSVATAEAAFLSKANDVATANASASSVANFNTDAATINAAVTTTMGTSISTSSSNINLSHSLIDGSTVNDHSNTGGTATFAAVGSAPSFTITASEEIGGNHSGVFFNDTPTGKTTATAAGWENSLSIGKFNGFSAASGLDLQHYDNDDFTLQETDSGSLYAFGFHLINNKKDGSEGLSITTNSGTTVTFADTANAGTNGIPGSSDDIPGYTLGEGTISGVDFVHKSFVGIVTDNLSDVFSLVSFDEGSDVNDIGIYDLSFGVAAVPVPAAVWLFISGLLAMFGFSKKRKV